MNHAEALGYLLKMEPTMEPKVADNLAFRLVVGHEMAMKVTNAGTVLSRVPVPKDCICVKVPIAPAAEFARYRKLELLPEVVFYVSFDGKVLDFKKGQRGATQYDPGEIVFTFGERLYLNR